MEPQEILVPKLVSDFVDYLRWRHIRFQEQRIERRFQIETSEPETEYLNEVHSANRVHAVPYEPIQLDIFKDMMGPLMQLIDRPSAYNFIDLGSGKGRALIYASEAGFERCTGIEFSEKLHQHALANIESYSLNSDRECEFSLYCMDAAEFTFPNNDIVLFMYNPFGIEVMKSVLDGIDQFARSNSNKMYVLYRNPTCAEDFASHHLELLDSQKSYQIFRVSR
jgi:predicted RNA methylase